MSIPQDAPFEHKLKDRLFARLGWRWVPGREAAIVMRHGKFHRIVSGPQEVWLSPSSEAIAFSLSKLPETSDCVLEDINTSDGPRVRIELSLRYLFEPWTAPRDKQTLYVMQLKTDSARADHVKVVAQWAAQKVFAGISSMRICAGSAQSVEFERQLFKTINERLNGVTMSLVPEFCAIQKIVCPEAITQRYEKLVERALAIKQVEALGADKVGQALRAEAVESLGKMTSGSPYVSVHDLTEMGGSPPDALQPPIIEHRSSTRPPAEEPPESMLDG